METTMIRQTDSGYEISQQGAIHILRNLTERILSGRGIRNKNEWEYEFKKGDTMETSSVNGLHIWTDSRRRVSQHREILLNEQQQNAVRPLLWLLSQS